jgi:hypothetical protein
MNRPIRRTAAIKSLCVSAIVSLVCLAGQASQASADTFNWNARFNFHVDLPGSGPGVGGPISPIDFAWSFEFDPLVTLTTIDDNQPITLKMFTYFSGAGATTVPTPLSADILTNVPDDVTLTRRAFIMGSQNYISFCNCVLRDFSLQDEWWNGDVDPDPNVQTSYQYYRMLSVSATEPGTAADVAAFDAMSMIDFLTMASSPGYTAVITEELRIGSVNLTTLESTTSTLKWWGPATLAGHVPGSPSTPTPVPEPASVVLVATGMAVTAIRKRARLC